MKTNTITTKAQRHNYFAYPIVLCCLIFGACIPARVPDNLKNTPGPAVVVDNNRYEGSAFSAQIPARWRVITGEAQTAPSVIFVAPDGKTLIRLMAGSVDESRVKVANQRNEMTAITLANATTVTVLFSSPYSTWTHYLPTFEQVRDSLSSR